MYDLTTEKLNRLLSSVPGKFLASIAASAVSGEIKALEVGEKIEADPFMRKMTPSADDSHLDGFIADMFATIEQSGRVVTDVIIGDSELIAGPRLRDVLYHKGGGIGAWGANVNLIAGCPFTVVSHSKEAGTIAIVAASLPLS